MSIHVVPESRVELVDSVITDLTTSLIQGVALTADFIADQIDGREEPKMRAWVKTRTGQLDFTMKDYDRALRNARIRKDLGGLPSYPAELIDLVVKRDKMTCLYNGQITKGGAPIIDGEVVSREEMENPLIADMVYFANPRRVNLDALMRQLRMLSDKHRLGFPDRAINDAVVEWVDIARKNRRYDLYAHLAGPLPTLDEREEVAALWLEIAEKLFVCTDESPAPFVAAIIQKFMHQVLRKLRGMPVYDHLMPVILGTQGAGKSTFVRNMMEPINELTLSVDFKMIEDDRNIDIWQAYALFIDEMGFASKANVDTVKNAITATALTRKPLYTNAKVEIDQNATFIGCSNKTLEQLIKDPTGIRRFVAVMYRNDPDWDFLNGLDWVRLWRSVDQKGPDPIAPFKAQLAAAQQQARDMGRVEHWIMDFDPSLPSFEAGLDTRSRVRAKLLYDLFREFEEEYYPGQAKTSLPDWGSEMRRTETAGQNNRFRLLGKVSGNVLYEFLG